MTKTKTPSAFAVARLLVRGEDGHDKMRDRAVDANLGPERDLDDVEKALRASSAPLAFALAASLESDSEEVFDADAVVALRAAHALWLWTASCVALWRARRVVRATARPGVFDVESVEAELRRRRRAASVVGRYWRARTPSAGCQRSRSETVFGGPRLIYESDIDTYLHVHVENSRAGLLIQLVRVRLRLYARVARRERDRRVTRPPAWRAAPPSSRLGRSRPRRSAPGLPPSPWWCAWWCACSRLTRT